MQQAKPILIALASGVMLAAGATEAEASPPITLEVTAPQQGKVFACRIPVTVRAPDNLRALNAIAKAYDGDDALASSGIATGVRPLVRHRQNGIVEYVSVPLQFDLTEGVCERVTALYLVFARCRFDDGETTDCLDHIRFEPRSAGKLSFHVGEPGADDRLGKGD